MRNGWATGRAWASGALVSIACVAMMLSVLGPACVVAVMIAAGVMRRGLGPIVPGVASWRLLAESLGWAGMIAALATLLACAAAPGLSRARPAVLAAACALPMTVPSYLAYAGWGLLRAPGTALGDLLASLPQPTPGFWALLAGRIQAVGGLALWSWPVAAAVLALGVRRTDPDVYRSLRLEPAGPITRARFILRLHRWDLCAAWGTVALLMLGSAVPLHLAQMRTYAMATWLALAEQPHSERWAVWGRALPLVLVAMVGGAAVVRAMGQRGSSEAPAPGRARWRGTMALLSVSVVVPAALFAASMERPRAAAMFFRAHAGAFAQSGLTALAVGGLGALLCAVLWWLACTGRRGLVVPALCAMVGAALVPGVIVGTATAEWWRLPGLERVAAATPAAVVSACLARTGVVAALMAVWLSASEDREITDVRRVDGATDLPSWARTGGATVWCALAACAAVMGVLTLHEIEATVFVLPPGAENLAYQMLQLLHQGRDDALAAGVLAILGAVALPVGAMAALVAVLERRRGNGRAGWVVHMGVR